MRWGLILAIVIVGLVGFAWWRGKGGGAIMPRTGNPKDGRVEKPDAEWRQALSDEQYRVTRRKGTERAFTGAYHSSKTPGMYLCVCCGQELFGSDTKFDSGTGWPSYWQPVDIENVSLVDDSSFFSSRTEVTCSRCDAHLGHVFNDGPAPTGLRYCINSASLKFIPKEEK